MSAKQERTETVEERVARLELRLADGFQRIGEAMSHGVDVDNWERHFVNLVREYEGISDEIAAHHAETVALEQATMAGIRRPNGRWHDGDTNNRWRRAGETC